MSLLNKSKQLSMSLLVVIPWLSSTASADDHSPIKHKPKLILQVTVDQLRGDLPTRYYDRLGDGGFKYLWEQGLVYSNAFHEHANTETIVGHTTLATGAQPAVHGMVGNLWLDRVTGLTTYNIEDPNYRLLSKGADVNAKAENGKTPLSIASESGNEKIAEILKSHGAK